MIVRLIVLMAALSLIAAIGCREQTTTGDSEEPATIQSVGAEGSLNSIKLSESAKQRLGISTTDATIADVRQQWAVSGEVVVPSGQTAIVSAPFAGTLAAPGNSAVPVLGSHLDRGQAVFNFTPVLTPERDVLTTAERVNVARNQVDVSTARVEAERQIATGKVQVEAATIALNRAERLLENRAGSQRSVDEARIQLKLAEEELITAQARYESLTGQSLNGDAGEIRTTVVTTPVAGILQSLEATAGETVSAGSPLFHVVNLDTVWIRVPVYVGRLREIDTESPASISEFGSDKSASPRTANYVAAPPSADSTATTVDLFFELSNTDAQLYPGQKLSVRLPLKSHEKGLTVPWSAVLYDIHGGAWLYEQTAPRTYVRRRIEVKFVDNGQAVLAAGPPPGSKVVSVGASELFGFEFGVGE